MAKRKSRTEKTVYDREQKIEDIQRIKNILNRGTKKDKKKNPYLKPDGSLDLIDKFVGIDYMPYEKKIKKSKKIRWWL